MYKILKRIIKRNKTISSSIIKILNYNANKRAKYLETIFEKVIEGSVVVKISNIPGEYEFDPRSHVLKQILLSKKNEYEPQIVEGIIKNIDSNKDAINVGANVGLYTNLIANNISPKKKVLAFEPTKRAFKMLQNNVKRNHNKEKVVLFNGIAANKNGDFSINIVKGKEEYSSLGKLVHPSINKMDFIKKSVKGVTVDSLVDKYNLRPGIIVLDAEGAELNVLEGAIETLKTYQPIIISEVYDELMLTQNADSKKLIKFLEGLKYIVSDINKGSLVFPYNGNIIAKLKIPLTK
ncbi:MAG: FkbM family methyltransferase [Flavobacteriaceae bacterium]|nr:FkbM family methyltransferase [Flavobacteriaceae bacterium]